MPISNVAVTANTATITVSSADVTNVSVTQSTSNISVGSATIIANSDIRAAISVTDTGGDGSLSYTEATGVITYTGPSASEVRAHLSSTDAGGDGSFSYDSGTGVMTYTGPSAAEVRAHLGNTDPVLYDSSTGVISLNNTTLLSGQTTDNLTQGSTNLYFSNALARNAIVSGIGMDYNNVTGAANVRHITNSRINSADNVFLHDDEISISGGNFNPGTTGLRGVKITPRNSSGGGSGDFIFTGMFVKSTSNMEDGYPIIGIGDDISEPGFQFVRMAGTSPEAIDSVLATFKNDDTFLVSGNLESNASLTVAGDIVGGGNLEITGNINYREVEDLLVRDQEIYLNYGNASAQTSTIYVDRSGTGGGANTYLRWNETADKWQFSNDGSAFDNIGAGTSTLGTIDTGTYITGGPVSSGNITIDLDTSATDGRYTKVITAGAGLSGAGTAGDVTLDVGAGDGITVVADDVQLNVAYTRNQFSAGGSLAYNSGTGEFSFTERSNSDILNLVDADFESDASIHRIAKLRGTEFKIASNATNLQNDVYSYSFPNDDGTTGQALITDGNGTLSFGAVATTYNNASVQNFLENGYGSANILTSGKITQGETRTELIYSVGNTMVLGTETGTPVAFGSNVRIVPGKFSGSDSGTRLVVGDDSNAPYLTFLTGHQSQSLAVGGRLSVNQSLDLGGRYLYLGADQYKGFSTYVDTNTPGNVSLQFGVGNVNTTAGNVNTFAGIRASRDTRDGVRDYSMKMGWFDPIPAEEPNFDSGATNWIPFSDLADTKVDTTFDANLTVTGNLITTGPTISSSDITTTGDFVGDLDGAVLVDVYNDTGGTLNKGQAVYLTGANTGDNPHVNLTENNDSAKMPAIGIVKENISTGFAGQVVTSGVINVASHGYTLGADLYIDTSAGTLTTTKPTGEDKLIQKIGKVVSSNHILVQGAFRTAETPSLNSGNIFLGNGSNETVTADFTDTANTAIADYDGDITPANVTYTGLLTTSGATSGEVTANILGNVQLGFAHSGSSFGDTVMVGDTSAEGGHYNPGFIGYGGKSLVVSGSAYIGQALNFGRQALNLSTGLDSTSSTGDGTIALSSLGTFRSNVHIGMPVGNVNGTPNQVVGIKTNQLQDTKLGWYDPLVRTSSGSNSYNKEKVYNPSTAPNGWYAFGDLAKTTFDETFDANLTVIGNFFPEKTSLKQFNETVVALGSQSGDLTSVAAFNAANASIFSVTATGGITLNTIPNAVAGTSFTIKVIQDGAGGHTLSSTMLFAGGDKTLSTAAGAKDVISVVYDGTDYLASLTKAYA